MNDSRIGAFVGRFPDFANGLFLIETTGSSHPMPEEQADVAAKIARLVQERGWNQEDFARITHLNRHTVRSILNQQGAKLRNATVQACAKALGVTVVDLRTVPLERLVARLHGQVTADVDERLRKLEELATRPELKAWLQRNPERAVRLSPTEVEELIAAQEPNGPLSMIGVEQFVEWLERRRELIRRVNAIAGTEFLPFLEQFVALLHDRIQIQ